MLRLRLRLSATRNPRRHCGKATIAGASSWDGHSVWRLPLSHCQSSSQSSSQPHKYGRRIGALLSFTQISRINVDPCNFWGHRAVIVAVPVVALENLIVIGSDGLLRISTEGPIIHTTATDLPPLHHEVTFLCTKPRCVYAHMLWKKEVWKIVLVCKSKYSSITALPLPSGCPPVLGCAGS